MRLPRFMRPVWSLAALGLALTLLTAPVAARADDDDDDNTDNGRQGTVRIYGGDDAQGGYLGVQVQDVTRALQRARSLPTDEGALVSRVEEDSPADRAGVRRGDVITEVDREKIESSQDLIKVVRGLSPGSRTRITLWRSGSLRTVNVQLGERPQGMPGMGMPNLRFPSNDDHPMPPQMEDRDVQQQIRDLRDQLRELRQEIQSLRQELQRSNGHDDDHDNDRSKDNDSDDDD
ncbi:MAG TPA: PDZ domain-containing protein [Candidatus Binatia bacterium]|nr:PDZ domain-containing protein [Candidatus Binatia bacterium]